MPIFEYECIDPRCQSYGIKRERFEQFTAPPVPSCEDCGETMTRSVSCFGIVFTGILSGTKYKEPGISGYHIDGHYAWDKPTDTAPAKPVFIETFDQQREFCKRNKLVNPKDIDHICAGSDGKMPNTRGLPSAAKLAKEYTGGNPDR